MSALPASVTLEVRCVRPPIAWEGAAVYLGVQKGREVVDIQAPTPREKKFLLEFRLSDFNGVPNFLGPWAQGTRDERFFYLSWGRGASPERFQMFRRLKVHLSHVTWRHIEAAVLQGRPLGVSIAATDRCGGPLCGAAWPDHPAIVWKLS